MSFSSSHMFSASTFSLFKTLCKTCTSSLPVSFTINNSPCSNPCLPRIYLTPDPCLHFLHLIWPIIYPLSDWILSTFLTSSSLTFIYYVTLSYFYLTSFNTHPNLYFPPYEPSSDWSFHSYKPSYDLHIYLILIILRYLIHLSINNIKPTPKLSS